MIRPSTRGSVETRESRLGNCPDSSEQQRKWALTTCILLLLLLGTPVMSHSLLLICIICWRGMGSLKLEQQSTRINRWSMNANPAPTTKSSTSSSSTSSALKEMTNESMDSGIAGLRDVRGSPAVSPATPLVKGVRHLSVDKQLAAQYIVDSASRTTYLKGRFLGKVLIFFLLNIDHYFYYYYYYYSFAIVNEKEKKNWYSSSWSSWVGVRQPDLLRVAEPNLKRKSQFYHFLLYFDVDGVWQPDFIELPNPILREKVNFIIFCCILTLMGFGNLISLSCRTQFYRKKSIWRWWGSATWCLWVAEPNLLKGSATGLILELLNPFPPFRSQFRIIKG